MGLREWATLAVPSPLSGNPANPSHPDYMNFVTALLPAQHRTIPTDNIAGFPSISKEKHLSPSSPGKRATPPP